MLSRNRHHGGVAGRDSKKLAACPAFSFLLDLCIEFGEPDPDKMIERLGKDSGRLLAMWAAYNRRNPFGYKRHNMHAAQIVCSLAKVHDPSRLMVGDTTAEMDAAFEAAREAREESDG